MDAPIAITYTPEKRSGPDPYVRNLAKGILLQAIRDLMSASKEEWRKDAEAWFDCRDDAPGSLNWVCSSLGLDDEAVRDSYRTWKGQGRSRIEILRQRFSSRF